MTFDELNLTKPLLKALEELEFVYPTKVQIEAFPVIMSGRDVVGISQTGTGKTLAYLLPLVRLLKFTDQKEPRVLIIAPTRELVIQISEAAKQLTKHVNLRVVAVYGGTNINTQKQKVFSGCDILVGTPGRVFDLYLTGVVRLNTIQKLVIDEVDELLNLGFRPQVVQIMNILPQKRQNLLFSATLSEPVRNILDEYFNNPQRIEISPHGTPIEKIHQQYYTVPNFITKVNLLYYLLKNHPEMSKVLVFARSKKAADRLFEKVNELFPDQAGVIHSNKSQNFRINAIRTFDSGSTRLLIATDLVARGLDFQQVSHVINFDLPEQPGDYIHRVGRTGRADQDGSAISFINEADLPRFNEIENLTKVSMEKLDIPAGIEVSRTFSEDDIPAKAFEINYLPKTNAKGKGAFHEKKDKNKKENWGGPKERQKKKVKKKEENKKPKFRF